MVSNSIASAENALAEQAGAADTLDKTSAQSDPFRMAAWRAPRGMRGWLTDDRSLTARIRSRCGRFALQVVSQGKGTVLPDEMAA